MDKWQKTLYEKLVEFIGDTGELVELGINKREAYILIKALGAQDMLENPPLLIPEDMRREVKINSPFFK